METDDGDVEAPTLVGKSLFVVHLFLIMWRMMGVPQNLRHKNVNSVAHLHCAPQKFQISVTHLTPCATEIFLWRTPRKCATKLFFNLKKGRPDLDLDQI